MIPAQPGKLFVVRAHSGTGIKIIPARNHANLSVFYANQLVNRLFAIGNTVCFTDSIEALVSRVVLQVCIAAASFICLLYYLIIVQLIYLLVVVINKPDPARVNATKSSLMPETAVLSL